MARPKKPAEEPIIAPWFKIWTRWNNGITKLTNTKAGELLKAMISFSIDGTEPKFKDDQLDMLWSLIADQMLIDRQKYIDQVTKNRDAGRKSAKNRAEKNAKKLYQKSGVFEAENTDGTRDSQQVLTTVNEERREKEEEPKEPKEKKRIEVTDSLDKATTTSFDVDGYNMANDLWFKYNGRQSLSPQEKSYLRKCVAQHGAEFICGCIAELKREKKLISTTTLPAVIEEMQNRAKEEKARAEAEAKQRELEKKLAKATEKAKDDINKALMEANCDGNLIVYDDHQSAFHNYCDKGGAGSKVLVLLMDRDFRHNGIIHVELAKEIIQDLRKRKDAGEEVYINTFWLLKELEKRS